MAARGGCTGARPVGGGFRARYLFAFLGRLLVLMVAVNFALVLGENWQVVIAVTLAVLAFVVFVVNVRDVWRR